MKSLPISISSSLPPMFPSRSLRVSCLRLRSFNHFELIFVQDKRYVFSFILSHVDYMFSQHHSFFWCIFLTCFSKIEACSYVALEIGFRNEKPLTGTIVLYREVCLFWFKLQCGCNVWKKNEQNIKNKLLKCKIRLECSQSWSPHWSTVVNEYHLLPNAHYPWTNLGWKCN